MAEYGSAPGGGDWIVIPAKWSHGVVVKTIGAAEFRAHCLEILDNVDSEGIVITKRGKPVARLMPAQPHQTHARFIGIIKEEIRVDPTDDLLSTGAWVSDEWGDANNGRDAGN